MSATELVCGISGESESKIRDTFDAALASGRCILFIDEIDAICAKREMTDNAMMKRMVTQMARCFDGNVFFPPLTRKLYFNFQ